jgi:hypothetical protein
MLDNMSINHLIEQQIKTVVEERVHAILAQPEWIDNLEQRITKYAQDRIVGRFANISTVPDLIDTVQDSVKKLFDQGHVPGLENYVSPGKITQAIDTGIQVLVNTAIDNLVIDTEWQNKIERSVNQLMATRLGDRLSAIDLNSLIVSHIDAGVDRWQDRLKRDFRTNGISDQASNIELTVMNGVVVVERDFVAKNIQVEQDLIVNNLVVSGAINTDNRSWNELKDVISQQVLTATTEQWRQDLVDQVVLQSRTAGINFDSSVI